MDNAKVVVGLMDLRSVVVRALIDARVVRAAVEYTVEERLLIAQYVLAATNVNIADAIAAGAQVGLE